MNSKTQSLRLFEQDTVPKLVEIIKHKKISSMSTWSDWLLCISAIGGLLWPTMLTGIFFAAILHRPSFKIKWEIHHTFLLAAAAIGMSIILTRDIGNASALILRYSFLWSLPFIILIYRPDEKTISIFHWFVFIIFIIDMAFNVGGRALGQDLLGRVTDMREGLVAMRMGGIFGHSFYSGLISLTAITAMLGGRYSKIWAIFPAINLIMAGSWRLTVAIPLILLFFIWKKRTYAKEILAVATLSILAVFTTLQTSGFSGKNQMFINDANTLRVFAWITAIQKISASPLTGIGYPAEKIQEGIGMDNNLIDDSLIAESWYLSSAITFGLPYTILRLMGIGMLFYSRRHTQFGKIACPLILVDLTYGGFFEGTLFYIMLWLQLSTFPDRKITTVKQGYSLKNLNSN